jgi:alanine dehydrogenase
MSRKLAHAHEIANMPAAVARSSTAALNNATLPYVMALADKGYADALSDNLHFRDGLNVHAGAVTHPAVAEALGLPFTAAEKIIGG